MLEFVSIRNCFCLKSIDQSEVKMREFMSTAGDISQFVVIGECIDWCFLRALV